MKTPGPNFFLDPLSLSHHFTQIFFFSSKGFPKRKKKFYSEQNRKKVTKNFTWFSMFQSLNRKKKSKDILLSQKKYKKERRQSNLEHGTQHMAHW